MTQGLVSRRVPLARCACDRARTLCPLQSIGSGLVLAGAVAGLIAAPVDKQFATPHSFVGAVITVGVVVQVRHGYDKSPPRDAAADLFSLSASLVPVGRLGAGLPPGEAAASSTRHAGELLRRRASLRGALFLPLSTRPPSLPPPRLSQHRKAWLSLHHWMGFLLPVLACVNAFLGVLVRAAAGGQMTCESFRGTS